MCGRYAFFSPSEAISELFEIENPPPVEFSYNVAPTDFVPAIRSIDDERRVSMLRWGLIPFWAKDKKIGAKMINARSETVAQKPAFKNAYRKRRCLLPANGFFEWQKTSAGKVPHFIELKSKQPFAFAGIWESWGRDSEQIESVSIITTQPNELLAPIHNRMPVILPRSNHAAWLGETSVSEDTLQSYLKPYPDSEMQAYPVTRAVNNPRDKSDACISSSPSDSLF